MTYTNITQDLSTWTQLVSFYDNFGMILSQLESLQLPPRILINLFTKLNGMISNDKDILVSISQGVSS